MFYMIGQFLINDFNFYSIYESNEKQLGLA